MRASVSVYLCADKRGLLVQERTIFFRLLRTVPAARKSAPPRHNRFSARTQGRIAHNGPEVAHGCPESPCPAHRVAGSKNAPVGLRRALWRLFALPRSSTLDFASATRRQQYHCSTSNFIQTANGGMQFVWDGLSYIFEFPRIGSSGLGWA